MSNYQFNKHEILQKAKNKYSKEKAVKYYLKTKEAIKEKSKNRYKNLSKEEKGKNKEYQRKRYQQVSSIKMKYYSPNKFFFTKHKNDYKIWRDWNWQKKNSINLKKTIDLNLVDTNKIIISDKWINKILRKGKEKYVYFNQRW